MSNLIPNVTVMDKGLELQTPKMLAQPGSALDMLNYEQVDFQGQKRIDGYARYDGSYVPALDDYLLVEVASNASYVLKDLVGVAGALLGVVVGKLGSTFVCVAVSDDNALPVVDDNLQRVVNGVFTDTQAVVSSVWGAESDATPAQHYTYLLVFTDILRSRIEELPGYCIGLHWFRDRLYAVSDVISVFIAADVTTLYPGATVTSGAATATVLDIVKVFTSEDELAGVILYLDAMSSTYNSWATGQTITGVGVVADMVDHPATNDVASMFMSRTEQQVLDEDGPSGPYDFGWKFIHLGWRVMFKDGLALFGGLTALNQNRTGVGIQGPTDTSGESGRPLILSQKPSITNAPAQVNGWKTSTNPALYTVEPSALTNVDGTVIYADAYITWDGTTGIVSAPGSDMVGLVEYSPTNNVVVDV